MSATSSAVSNFEVYKAANKVPSGSLSITINGIKDVSQYETVNVNVPVGTPTLSGDAANKAYVDAVSGSLNTSITNITDSFNGKVALSTATEVRNAISSDISSALNLGALAHKSYTYLLCQELWILTGDGRQQHVCAELRIPSNERTLHNPVVVFHQPVYMRA